MLKACLFIVTSLMLSSNALAQWKLINDQSSINYVSIKKSTVGEVNSFKTLEGSIAGNGELAIEIDLASVETNIPIRNDRMKTFLFEIASFEKARISAAVDLKALSEMKIGDTVTDSVNLSLSLHGVSQDFVSDVRVVKLSENRVLAVSLSPIIVNADHYQLTQGIEKLRELANLPSISSAVPVTFSLVFSAQ